MQFTITDGTLDIDTIVLDLNGTLAVHGKLVKGVEERITALRQHFKLIVFTGDQRGDAAQQCAKLGIECRITKTGSDKNKEMKTLGKHCAAIGNARIDIGTFKHAALSIVTLQAEGIHADVLRYADIIVPSILDALDLFLHPDALTATMKK